MQMLAIALLFPEPISEKIDELRIRYGTPRVRAVVPHITLKQPFVSRVETDIIIDQLQFVAATTRWFTVLFNKFDYFEVENTLVFIAIDNPEPISTLYSQIVHSLRGLTEGGDEHELDRFISHITINYEIPKDRLSSFKSELATYEFSMDAILDTFVLFANDGTGWKHIHTFHLTG
jgi:2'-5' RNA ligase